VLGTRLDRLTLTEAAERVIGLTEHGRFSLVVTTNPEMIMQARYDPELRAILDEAALSVADGVGVVWASRFLGCPVPERVAGIDLMDAVLSRAAEDGLGVYLLGTRQHTIERAASAVVRAHPGLRLVGYHHGYFGDDEAPRIIESIRNVGPDLLFSGMGVPRDQKLLYRWRERLGPLTAMGVGGSFDVIAGEKRRAPAWVRRLHGEWLYRVLTEPSRLPRQATRLPAFVASVFAERLSNRA